MTTDSRLPTALFRLPTALPRLPTTLPRLPTALPRLSTRRSRPARRDSGVRLGLESGGGGLLLNLPPPPWLCLELLGGFGWFGGLISLDWPCLGSRGAA